jgi:protein-disulfide isomerase
MALPARFSGHRYGSVTAPFLLEVFLDFTCPFSARLYKRLTQEVLPWLDKHHPDKVQFIFRHQIQPWHPQSTLVHEASLAAERVASSKFFHVATFLFEHQLDYFDEQLVGVSFDQVHRKLSEQLAKVIEVPTKEIYQYLEIKKGEPLNAGNRVSNDLKWHIKYARQLGVHVSPTVYWNGILDNSVSSSWTLEQWQDYLEKQFSA